MKNPITAIKNNTSNSNTDSEQEKVQVSESIDFEKIIRKACELPYCRIDREAFLTRELKNRLSEEQLADALRDGTINAKIPINILNHVAKSSITLETSKATAISTAAGIPGGIAMFGTIPGDLAQFYAHIFRIAQKLAYIYGAKEIDFDDGSQSVLMIYMGAMLGVNAACAALAKFAAANAAKIGARVASKPLTKLAAYNIAKKILAGLGVRLSKGMVGKGITKAIPVLGGVLSGGITVATFLPMAKKLQKELAKYSTMTPDDLEKANAEADVVIEKFTSDENIVDADFVEVSDDVDDEHSEVLV